MTCLSLTRSSPPPTNVSLTSTSSPVEVVFPTYEDALANCTSHPSGSGLIRLHTSEKNMKQPFSTPSTTGRLPSKSSAMRFPMSLTLSSIASSEKRTFSMCGCTMAW